MIDILHIFPLVSKIILLILIQIDELKQFQIYIYLGGRLKDIVFKTSLHAKRHDWLDSKCDKQWLKSKSLNSCIATDGKNCEDLRHE